jgi:hypothetical protein
MLAIMVTVAFSSAAEITSLLSCSQNAAMSASMATMAQPAPQRRKSASLTSLRIPRRRQVEHLLGHMGDQSRFSTSSYVHGLLLFRVSTDTAAAATIAAAGAVAVAPAVAAAEQGWQQCRLPHCCCGCHVGQLCMLPSYHPAGTTLLLAAPPAPYRRRAARRAGGGPATGRAPPGITPPVPPAGDIVHGSAAVFGSGS